MTAVSVLNIN